MQSENCQCISDLNILELRLVFFMTAHLTSQQLEQTICLHIFTKYPPSLFRFVKCHSICILGDFLLVFMVVNIILIIMTIFIFNADLVPK